MDTADTAAMDPEEIRAFVGRGGTGVLSLAKDAVPYSTPVSYGFDPDARAFLLRLGFGTESEKHAFVEASADARLVIYDRVDGEWLSVIAVGPLRRVPAEALTPDLADALRQADLPLFDIWDEPMDEIDFDIYRLEAQRLTGRRGVGDESG